MNADELEFKAQDDEEDFDDFEEGWQNISLKKKSKKPEHRCGHVAVPVAAGLAIVGGYNTTLLEDGWRLVPSKTSPGAVRWTRMKIQALPSPFPRTMYRGCGSSEGESSEILISCGTEDGVTMLNDVWKLDLRRLEWERVSPPPPPPRPEGGPAAAAAAAPAGRCNHGMAALGGGGGRALVHGGEGAQGALLADAWLFDSAARAWVAGRPGSGGATPGPRCSHSAAALPPQGPGAGRPAAALFGGCGPPPSSPRGGAAAAAAPGRGEEEGAVLAASGGAGGGGDEDGEEEETVPLNDLWVVTVEDFATGALRYEEVQCGFGPSPRSLAALTCLSDGSLLLFGGFGLCEIEGSGGEPAIDITYLGDTWQCTFPVPGESSSLNEGSIFCGRRGGWRELATQSAPRNGHTISQVGSIVIAYGGFCGEDFVTETEFLEFKSIEGLVIDDEDDNDDDGKTLDGAQHDSDEIMNDAAEELTPPDDSMDKEDGSTISIHPAAQNNHRLLNNSSTGGNNGTQFHSSDNSNTNNNNSDLESSEEPILVEIDSIQITEKSIPDASSSIKNY